MTREHHPGDNEKSIRRALSSEWQGMRNKNQVAKSKNRPARSELLVTGSKELRKSSK